MMDKLFDMMIELADITNDCSSTDLLMKRHGYLIQYMIKPTPITRGSVEYLYGVTRWMRIKTVLDNILATVNQTFTTTDTFAKWLGVLIEFLVNVPTNLPPDSINKSWYVQLFDRWQRAAIDP